MKTMLGMFMNLLETLDRMIKDEFKEPIGLLHDLFAKLGSPESDGWWTELKKFLRKEPCWVERQPEEKPNCLKLISGNTTITLDPADGKRTIANASDIFVGIDGNFEKQGTNVPGPATEKTDVTVHQMVKNGDFRKIFGSFGSELDKLCLTQDQIIQFVEKHKNWLRKDGYATFFLFKAGDEFFVAHVRAYSVGRPIVNLHRLSNGYVWLAASHHRVVVLLLRKATDGQAQPALGS